MKTWDLEREYRELLDFVIDGREQRKGDSKKAVEGIREEFLAGGDKALVEFSRRWDGWEQEYPLKFREEELAESLSLIPRKDVAVLKGMMRNVTAYHRGQKWPKRIYKEKGLKVTEELIPVENALVYVPGGTAPYPSSLVMGAVPAQIAGVKHIAVATPAKNGVVNPYILACSQLLGIRDVYRIGGAQAIYAFSYGTETIPKVDMIVGPGNAFVEEAKRDVYGRVGIDMLAGPTELIVLCTEDFSPDAIAWDLFSQAEHDEMATVGLFCPDRGQLNAVRASMERLMGTNRRRAVIEKALEKNSFFVHYGDVEKAVAAINAIAPEHMELIGDEGQAKRILYPGILYVGPYTTVAMGDYYIGTNHVLPTGGSGRFIGGLSVDRFMRRKVVVKISGEFLATHGNQARRLAEIEGLFAHGEAIRIRKES